ncbi:hypothetical protein HMPREF1619_04802 [Klebsiella pneumoniae 909957]|nr:hypothetical protein HMPREF9538_05926 [Klebsiella sp. MS 92-3]ESA98074.1 hypothetical protein HMPREF1619_04802 [Klebsiella pneumoniae 909957]KXA20488.1 hypothetical protein HMPREF3197_05260 [Klebsiella pneumoniae]
MQDASVSPWKAFRQGLSPFLCLRRIATSRIIREISHKAKKASTLF